MLPNPLNLQAWIDEHRHLLKPPVGNRCIYDGDFIVMVVGGPNARTDYHYDEGPEWFHQLEGEMVLRIQEHTDEGRGAARDIAIKAGETFLLPPRVPHSPQRMAGGIGLVLTEQIRVLEWQEAAFIILLVLVTVAIIDAISGRLRAAIAGTGRKVFFF